MNISYYFIYLLFAPQARALYVAPSLWEPSAPCALNIFHDLYMGDKQVALWGFLV